MTDLNGLERRHWAAADALRANSSLTPAEYQGLVHGLIFLAFAEHRFDELRPELELKATERRPLSADDFRARGGRSVLCGEARTVRAREVHALTSGQPALVRTSRF
jgi:hypothetical protein